MTVGYVAPPRYAIRGGQRPGPIFKYDVYKGRYMGRGGMTGGCVRKGAKKLRGKFLMTLVRRFGPAILKLFKSPAMRRAAKTVGTAGASAAINTAVDKLTTRKRTPVKSIAKDRGTEAALNVLHKAQDKLATGTGWKRRQNRKKKKKKQQRGRGIKRVTKKKTKKKKKRDIFD